MKRQSGENDLSRGRDVVTMRLYAPNWLTRGGDHSSEFRALVEVGIPISVLVNHMSRDVKISASLVETLLRKHPVLEDQSEDEEGDHVRRMKVVLKYGSFEKVLEFAAWVEREEALGSDLPDGIDLELGYDIALEIQLFKRARAYLLPRAGGFNPVFRGRDFRTDPGLCFVLMPFGEPWSDRVFRRHIKPAVESLGITCSRADDFFAPGVIMEDVWKAINQANFIIADLTARNPNVFYELGLAHVVGVPTILLSQTPHTPAFDTVHWRQILYQDNSDGCEILEKSLKSALIAFLKEMTFP